MATKKKRPKKTRRLRGPALSEKGTLNLFLHLLDQAEQDPEAFLEKTKKLGQLGKAVAHKINTNPKEVVDASKPVLVRLLAKALKQHLS